MQVQLTNKEERSKLNMTLVGHASASAFTKLVRNIQSNPDKVLDVSQLELHHAIGKEATDHLRGRNIGNQLTDNVVLFPRRRCACEVVLVAARS